MVIDLAERTETRNSALMQRARDHLCAAGEEGTIVFTRRKKYLRHPMQLADIPAWGAWWGNGPKGKIVSRSSESIEIRVSVTDVLKACRNRMEQVERIKEVGRRRLERLAATR